MGNNEQLVEKIQSGEQELMGELWKQNKGLVRLIAARYLTDNGRLYDTDDLMQNGYIGLHQAALSYCPERGAAFSTYAGYAIRNAMREVTGLRGKRDAIFDARPLDAPFSKDRDETPLDLLPAPDDSDTTEQDELSKIMHEAVAHIADAPSRQMIEAVYWNGQTVGAAAWDAHITRTAAGERLQKGYAILRRNKLVRALALADGLDYTYYRFKGLSAFQRSRSSSVEDAATQHESIKKRQSALLRLLGELAAPPK